ncbi:transporter substrate-binding domain-containing protein, partial [Anaerovorax sp. IOR16]|uniref:transporter substrate-binding domain-containing protein n=1 Tax=Anaerovorax sp. IOR16 TaxID=2773458 RepID=UPI0019D2E62F
KIDTRSWSEIYQDLLNGHVDILFAANESEERKKWMSFTKPVYKNPYAIITKDGSTIQTIGDIDQRKVGFVKDDIIIELLPKLYNKINYQKFVFDDKNDGVEAVHRGLIDAFITAGALLFMIIHTPIQI